MSTTELRVVLPQELALDVAARAREAGQPLDDFVSCVLRVGLDQRQARPPRRSRTPARAGRARRPREEMPWRCPGDWTTFDSLVPMAEDHLAVQSDISREDLRRRLMAAVTQLPAEDPAGVVERALDTVLGPAYAEFLRQLPGEAAHRPPD